MLTIMVMMGAIMMIVMILIIIIRIMIMAVVGQSKKKYSFRDNNL